MTCTFELNNFNKLSSSLFLSGIFKLPLSLGTVGSLKSLVVRVGVGKDIAGEIIKLNC